MLQSLRFLLALSLCCVLFTGCKSDQRGEPSGSLAEESGASSAHDEFEIIDPLEEAARLDAPSSDADAVLFPLPARESSEEESEDAAPPVSAVLSDPAPTPLAEPVQEPSAVTIREDSAPDPVREAIQPFAAEEARLGSPVEQAQRIEKKLLAKINEERGRNGLESLGMEDAMQFAARTRAQEALDSLSHTRPGGTAYYTAFDESGFSYAGKWHGENVAVTSAEVAAFSEEGVAEALFQEWVSSPGHHQNMLGENFFQTGIGVYMENRDDIVIIGSVQLFASL